MTLANAAEYFFDLYQIVWWFDRVLHAAPMLAITFGLFCSTSTGEQREGWPAGENAPSSRFEVLPEERKLRQRAEAAERAGTK